MHPQRGGTYITYFFKLFIHSFTFILIIVPLCRKKICDGHKILVLNLKEQENCNILTMYLISFKCCT